MSGFWADVGADLARYSSRVEVKNGLKVYLIHAGFRVTFWYRAARHVGQKNRFIGKLFTFWLLRYQLQTGIQINPGTDIGPGLYMPHFGSIIVNTSSCIGANCYLSHDVTLGKAHAGDKKGAPTLGDGVFIGPGVKILGKIHIGNNAAIGANSVVVTSIPCNCFAVGAPARVVRNVGADKMLGH